MIGIGLHGCFDGGGGKSDGCGVVAAGVDNDCFLCIGDCNCFL